MRNRISKLIALTGVSAALVIGGAGVAQASSPDHGSQSRDHTCKTAQGKRTHDCSGGGKHHEKRHGKHNDKNKNHR